MRHLTQNVLSPSVVAVLSKPRGLTIGVDLGDTQSHYCVLDAEGVAVLRGRTRTTARAFKKFFARFAGCRVAYEVGTHSAWVTNELQAIGCEVIVANARKLSLIGKNERKNDANDSELLARLARVDPKLLCPIRHRRIETRSHQAILRARDALVRARTQLINCTRGLVKPIGARINGCSSESFHKQAGAQIPNELKPATGPLLAVISELTSRIHAYDKLVDKLCSERYPETKSLRQIAGVGPLTGLAYVLAIEDPSRFARSRTVGPYLGLVPKQRDSGKQEPQLRISKAGDRHVRRLLIGSAHYILGPFGPDCDLRRFGKAIASRGGKNAKKRAAVAVARRLAVLLHRLWVTRAEYDPLRHAKRQAHKRPA